MKHEAFSDALSMIDDKFVVEAQKPIAKRSFAPTVIKIGFAAAACAAAVCAFILFPRGNSADILISGEKPSAGPVIVRSYDNNSVGVIRAYAIEYLDIPVSITSSEKSVVEISGGTLRCEGNNEQADTRFEVFGNASLVWNVPLDDKSAEFTLKVQTGNQTRVFELSFDESESKWTMCEKQ